MKYVKTFDEYLNEGWILSDLEDTYNIKLDLFDNGEFMELSRIVIPKESRGDGIGSTVMQEIIDKADKENKPIYLTPSKDFGASSVSRLERFYKGFGFIKNKDKSVSKNTMVRMPK